MSPSASQQRNRQNVINLIIYRELFNSLIICNNKNVAQHFFRLVCTFLLKSVLKIDNVERELVRPDIVRDGMMLRDQIAQQTQKIAPSPLQLKIACALSCDNEYFPSSALDPHHEGRHPAKIPAASSSRD